MNTYVVRGEGSGVWKTKPQECPPDCNVDTVLNKEVFTQKKKFDF